MVFIVTSTWQMIFTLQNALPMKLFYMHFYRIVLSTHNHNDINNNSTYTNTGENKSQTETGGLCCSGTNVY